MIASNTTSTFNERSGPALAASSDAIYIAWTGTDGKLNVLASSDGSFSGEPATLDQSSEYNPAIAVFTPANGPTQIILASAGSGNNVINVLPSDGSDWTGQPVRLPETSSNGPALTTWLLDKKLS